MTVSRLEGRQTCEGGLGREGRKTCRADSRKERTFDKEEIENEGHFKIGLRDRSCTLSLSLVRGQGGLNALIGCRMGGTMEKKIA